VNEKQWLAEHTELEEMLRHLRAGGRRAVTRTNAGRRKLRLFVCACFRLASDRLDGPRLRLVEGLEALADGRAVEGGMDGLRALAAAVTDRTDLDVGWRSGWWSHVPIAAEWATAADQPPGEAALTVALHLAAAVEYPDPLGTGRAAHRRRQAALLRDVFGNPFRPLPQRRGFAAEIRGLALACYDDAAQYPLLADALADLGEDAAAEHCRRPDGHVKGCHVVDWVLGRG
jgi:hypothetical protein